MTPAQSLASKIDEAFAAEVAKTEDGLRRHLGASVAGDPCMRKLWYSFHWATTEKFDGRMLRLFERGQLEELRFVKLLRLVGATVYTHDSNGKQFQVFAHGGHFGGSCDGVATNVPDIEGPVLLEFKTFGKKSFHKLADSGVEIAKPEHFRQMQIYMRGLNLPRALYFAIEKDTDTLHIELIEYNAELAERMYERAGHIIFGGMPVRISDNSGWWECSYCPQREICHFKGKALVNCRTCTHSKPERDGTWSCGLNRTEIVSQPKKGCQLHEYMPELI